MKEVASNQGKSTIEIIKEAVAEEDESLSKTKFDVVFHNKAIEKILGFDNLQKDMHTPALILENKMHSLCAMTEITDAQLVGAEIKVVKREDHVHIDESNSLMIG